MKCPICKKENPSKIDFCRYCRYPLNIKGLDKMDKKDLADSFSGLLEVVSKERKILFKDKEIEQIYDELLSLHWLRPESALFRFIEAKILLNFRKKYLKYPLLDLGCGDGLFISILFGARINKEYDAYQAVDFKQKDIYNARAKLPKNFFDKKPLKIGFGMDIKKNLVDQASQLKVYDKVKIGDVRKLPFDNKSLNSVFSNMIDDIKKKDLDSVFKEVSRVLKPKGYFVFTSPTERFRKFLFYYNKKSKLDRGRSSWQPRSLAFWKKILKKTDFELVEYVEYGKPNVIQFWDTGFRPFSSCLIKFRNKLKEKGFCLLFKRIYLEIFREYLFKYVKNQVSKGGAFSIIVIKKI